MDKVSLYKELDKAGIDYKKDFSVKNAANFRIGGRVDAFVEIKDVKRLETAVRAAGKARCKYMAIGNMTNLLIADHRIKRVFIKLSGEFGKLEMKGRDTVYAGAAVKNEKLLNFMSRNGLGGLEFLAGIPGTVGGAVYMNAGAYGRGIGGQIKKVYYVDRKGTLKAIINKNLFSYRHSRFQDNGGIITGVDIRASGKDRKESAAEMKAIIQQRRAKHPWNAACAGSYFKNTPDIPAGKLIEMAGLKGKKVGGAAVSGKHANFLINTGGASFNDMIKLAELVKKTVYKKFKIKLKEEVIIIR
jgi:UDP-N-acetylmuramate dehydrogenase